MSKISNLTFHSAKHYITQKFNSNHNGTDYGTNNKKIKIYPIENGTIIYAGKDSYGGNLIKISYTRINKTFYIVHWFKSN